METEDKSIAVREAAVSERPADLLSVIAAAVSDPRMDVDKMERLLAMHERIVERNATVAFESALSRLQAKLPQIDQSGVILGKDRVTVRSRYAPLEDIDVIIRPMLAEEGFAISFDTEETEGGKIRLLGKLSHKDGHSVTKSLTLPIDKNEYRTAIQDHGSTVSFGRRYLIKMHLNLIEKYEDNGGQGIEPITQDQVRDIEVMMSEIPDLNKRGFLDYMGVDHLKEIRAKDLKKAINALETKRKGRR